MADLEFGQRVRCYEIEKEIIINEVNMMVNCFFLNGDYVNVI